MDFYGDLLYHLRRMENIPLLKDLVLLMAVAVPFSMLMMRLGLPAIIGFLITGVIIGPYGFALVTELHTVETLSQVGVVLLLFTIGLEFSVTRILNIRRQSLLGGGLQALFTTIIVLLIGLAFGFSFSVSLLIGFIITLSSTAIILKLLVDKGEVNSPHGSLSIGMLLFQDIAVVLMVMIIQSIGGKGADAGFYAISKNLGLSILEFGAIVVGVAVVIPRIFHRVVKLRNREVFILTIVLVCLGTAWLTSLAGLSLALGAFIAGLAISESEYSTQIVTEVIPFRDTFSALFFVSIGMLLDIRYLADHIGLILLLLASVVVLKTAAIIAVGRALSYSTRMAIVVGLNLAQIGEFSFILMKMGLDFGFLNNDFYQTLLAVTVLSMAAAPFIFLRSSRISFDAMHYFADSDKVKVERRVAPSNHVIITGYGLNGKNLARVLKETGINHLIVDVNMERVKDAKADGHRAYFGDPSHHEILKKMGIESAKMIVIAISDPISTRRIVKLSRELSPAVSILVRTRYIREVEDLYALGANQVIPEEFETSVEIFSRVLRDYRTPGNIIQNQIDLIRQEGYAMFRNPSTGHVMAHLTSILEKSLTDTFFIDESHWAANKTLHDIGLRKKTGATIIAVVRTGEARTNPSSEFTVVASDVLVILGSHAELNKAFALLNEKPDK